MDGVRETGCLFLFGRRLSFARGYLALHGNSAVERPTTKSGLHVDRSLSLRPTRSFFYCEVANIALHFALPDMH